MPQILSTWFVYYPLAELHIAMLTNADHFLLHNCIAYLKGGGGLLRQCKNEFKFCNTLQIFCGLLIATGYFGFRNDLSDIICQNTTRIKNDAFYISVEFFNKSQNLTQIIKTNSQNAGLRPAMLAIAVFGSSRIS